VNAAVQVLSGRALHCRPIRVSASFVLRAGFVRSSIRVRPTPTGLPDWPPPVRDIGRERCGSSSERTRPSLPLDPSPGFIRTPCRVRASVDHDTDAYDPTARRPGRRSRWPQRLSGRPAPGLGPLGRTASFPWLTGRQCPHGSRAVSAPGSRAVSAPGSRAVSAPMAHGPSVSPWLTGRQCPWLTGRQCPWLTGRQCPWLTGR
jgi:hypothetical protein